MGLFERILVPVDYSEQAVTVLRCAKMLALTFGSLWVEVLHVWMPPEPRLDLRNPLADRNMVEHQVHHYLDDLVIRDVPHFKRTSVVGMPAHVIRERSRDRDLVIIGTGSTSGLGLGNNAKKIVHRCHCPVLVVPLGKLFFPDGVRPTTAGEWRGLMAGLDSSHASHPAASLDV